MSKRWCHAKQTEPEVITQVRNNVGFITLNRPKALNALSLTMIRELHPVLEDWNKGGVSMVVMRGAGDKAFCAGGDIRAITEVRGSKEQKDFFREEYSLDHLIGTLKVPFVAILNGITMGGGVGVSVNGRFRVGTESTVFAMPECGIGLIPDVGASHFLPKLRGELGMFLALTGFRLKGWDCLHAGITTHAVDHSQISSLESDLEAISPNSTDSVKQILDNHTAKSQLSPAQGFSLEAHMDKISHIFSGGSVEEIRERLISDGSDWAGKHVKTMDRLSPTSLKVTYRQIREGEKMNSLAECLTMEHRLVRKCCEDQDFYEGVRALLIDKDNSPKWKPATLSEVTDEKIDKYFSPMSEDEEWKA